MGGYRIYLALILVIGIYALGGATPAAAQRGGISVTVRPARYDPDRPETQAYFVYNVEAGRRFRDEVRVINTGDQAGVVRLYAVDAATGQNSGAVYRESAAPRYGVGGWVALDVAEIALGPGEEQLIGFSVAVPAEARAGEHLGGIAVEGIPIDGAPAAGDFTVDLQVRSVVAVQVNLPGPQINRLVASGVSAQVYGGRQALMVQLHNQGNVMVKGQGAVMVFDGSGAQVALAPFQIDYILPGDTLGLPVFVPEQALPVGDYRAELRMTADGQPDPIVFSGAFRVTSEQVDQLYSAQVQRLPPRPAGGLPWPSLLSAGVAVALFMVYIVRRLRR